MCCFFLPRDTPHRIKAFFPVAKEHASGADICQDDSSHPPFQAHWNPSGIFSKFLFSFSEDKNPKSRSGGLCKQFGCWVSGLANWCQLPLYQKFPQEPASSWLLAIQTPSGFLTMEPFFPFWSSGILNPFSLLPKECSREDGSWEWAPLSADHPKVRDRSMC